eukprot:9136465-Pyramimonas_sp.AAC.1
METGRTPAGKRLIIEKADQVCSNILDGTVPDQVPKCPMREAYEIAQITVKNATIPSGSAPDGAAGHEPKPRPQAAVDPGPSKPPPLTRGE